MIKDYLARHDRKQGESTGDTQPTAAEKNTSAMRELQAQWGKMLTRCYELYAEGQRCVHEEDPLKRFDCSHCEHREADHFCRSNFFLKKLVRLVAEHLATSMIEKGAAGAPEQSAADPDGEEQEPAPLLTQEQIDEFKAMGVSYEIATPFCDEHIWLVPEKTGGGRLEFTPEEIHFMAQAAKTLEGTLVEITRQPPLKEGGSDE